MAAACVAASMSSCALLIDLQDRDLANQDASIGGGDGSTSDVALADSASDADIVTCDADIDADPENCGRCAHSCEGTQCVSGSCEVLTIASDLINPTGVALMNGDLYWIESGNDDPFDGGLFKAQVWRLPGDGGASQKIYTDGFGPVDSISAGNNVVFWSIESPSGASRVVSTKGAICGLPEISGSVTAVAAQDAVYAAGTASGAACLFDGGIIDEPLVDAGCHSAGFAVSGTNVLVVTKYDAEGDFVIRICPDGLANSATCNSLFNPAPTHPPASGAGMTSAAAFWIIAGEQGLFRQALPDSTTVSEFSLPLAPKKIAVDERGVFVVAESSDETTRPLYSLLCDATGCASPTTVFANDVTAAAADDRFVYVAVSHPLSDGGTNGAILKTARP